MRLAVVGVVCLLGLAASWPLTPAKGRGSGGSSYVSTTYPQGPCQPFSKTKYLCNDCTCDRDGLGYSCTRRECGPTGPQISPPRPQPDRPQISPPRPNPGGPQISPPRPYPEGPQISPPRPNPDRPQISPPRPYPEGPQISPPRPYPEGPQISPPRPNPDRPQISPPRPYPEGPQISPTQPGSCVPGTSFLAPDGCNTCTCTSNGVPACTKRACGNKCIPESSWHDGCNACRCTSSGAAICTQKACLPRPPPPAKGGK